MHAWQYLPNPWRQALLDLARDKRCSDLEEVRFRVDRPVYLYHSGWSVPLLIDGVALSTSAVELDRIVGVLVDHSLYARVNELRQGFVTLPGGHRVGIVGRAVSHHGQVETIGRISGINLRVARAVVGPGEVLTEHLTSLTGRGSWLLASPPRAGKTTILRDMVRFLGNQGWRVVVVDERSEIAGYGGAGVPGFDLGLHTDVLDAWPKSEGIEVAVRTLGPDIIAVDELGDASDFDAIAAARYAGVRVLATVHATNPDDLSMTWHKSLGMFDALVYLTAHPNPGTVSRIDCRKERLAVGEMRG